MLFEDLTLKLDNTGKEPKYNQVARQIEKYLMEQNVASAQNVLSEVAGLTPGDTLSKLILEYYQMLLSGCSLSQLCAKAELNKHAGMTNVI